ncbi:hypothetical protein Lser_V15G18785 [Lactuca serriola]
MIDRRTRAFDESNITTIAPAFAASCQSSSTSLSPFYPDNNNNATSSSPNYFSSSSSRNQTYAKKVRVDVVDLGAFVTDIEKLKLSNKAHLLEIESLMGYFLEVIEDGIQLGSNLLQAVEFLVFRPIDKQSLLDSGILSCLIYILNALLGPDGRNTRKKVTSIEEEPEAMDSPGPDQRLEVEGNVVHIMNALARHPVADQSLIEGKSLQLLFEMVANGSLILFSRYKEVLVPLHNIQLHRHAMEIKILLIVVKDFKPETGDPAYTLGIVDLLLECIELSYRPELDDPQNASFLESIRKSECLEELRPAKGRAHVHASLVRKLEDYRNLEHSHNSPVDCIHWTFAAQVSLLEDEMQRVERVNMGSSADVDTVSKFIELESLSGVTKEEWRYCE